MKVSQVPHLQATGVLPSVFWGLATLEVEQLVKVLLDRMISRALMVEADEMWEILTFDILLMIEKLATSGPANVFQFGLTMELSILRISLFCRASGNGLSLQKSRSSSYADDWFPEASTSERRLVFVGCQPEPPNCCQPAGKRWLSGVMIVFWRMIWWR